MAGGSRREAAVLVKGVGVSRVRDQLRPGVAAVRRPFHPVAGDRPPAIVPGRLPGEDDHGVAVSARHGHKRLAGGGWGDGGTVPDRVLEEARRVLAVRILDDPGGIVAARIRIGVAERDALAALDGGGEQYQLQKLWNNRVYLDLSDPGGRAVDGQGEGACRGRDVDVEIRIEPQ